MKVNVNIKGKELKDCSFEERTACAILTSFGFTIQKDNHTNPWSDTSATGAILAYAFKFFPELDISLTETRHTDYLKR